jgi:hypothetical protein
MYARLENYVVVEILDYDVIDDKFTADFVSQCVPCEGSVSPGMVWDGTDFVQPWPRTVGDIKADLAALDLAAVRSLRAVAAGTATQDDTDMLARIESDAIVLRAELAALAES